MFLPMTAEQMMQQEAVPVTDEQLKSGEVCYKLNQEAANGSQSVVTWHLTIGLDDYPVLLKDHGQVWFYDGAYTNDDPDGIREVKS
ncbi:MAG: hypothetical protein IJ615_01010 [Bacteroidaceae bacterium]|nr:hypothetical protein [Bacteroidaceae bacterium]